MAIQEVGSLIGWYIRKRMRRPWEERAGWGEKRGNNRQKSAARQGSPLLLARDFLALRRKWEILHPFSAISAKCHQAHSKSYTSSCYWAKPGNTCTLGREISASYLPSRGECDNASLGLSTRLWLRLAHVSIRQTISSLLHLDLRAQGREIFSTGCRLHDWTYSSCAGPTGGF
jgi:hypothetical protein